MLVLGGSDGLDILLDDVHASAGLRDEHSVRDIVPNIHPFSLVTTVLHGRRQ